MVQAFVAEVVRLPIEWVDLLLEAGKFSATFTKAARSQLDF